MIIMLLHKLSTICRSILFLMIILLLTHLRSRWVRLGRRRRMFLSTISSCKDKDKTMKDDSGDAEGDENKEAKM